MMAKITKGSSFGGCVKYVANKKDAEFLGAVGVRLKDYKSIADSMELQSQMNPKLGKKVGHISVNFSAQDKDAITNYFMLKIANQYMYAMGIRDTQTVVFRHNDTDHPHCHIVYNRVSNSGKTISDKNDRVRSTKICRKLTESHDLYLKAVNGKQNVKQDRLREPDKTKYEIYNSIKDGLRTAKSWPELSEHLRKREITLVFKYKGNTDERQGVVFSKNGQSFNGSKIDRQYSFSKLTARLDENAYRHKQSETVSVEIEQSQAIRHKTNVGKERQTYLQSQLNNEHSHGSGLGGLFSMGPSGGSGN
ncbi:MAG: relaxase/mobilization nuclease domain-containing protein, partial [Rikenellaceae bacterium]|nr:relaxase/mobilization nuclease domain-containing protein [Rikenellaceae bacterium]